MIIFYYTITLKKVGICFIYFVLFAFILLCFNDKLYKKNFSKSIAFMHELANR